MTIEEKAKAYDKALGRAKEMCSMPTDKATMEYIFPELRESEDEIHRKWILEYLYDGLRKTDEQFKDHFKSAIDWLEKQKEQKPVEWTELTWKDIVELEGIINNVHYDFSAGIGQESFGKEVLERFRNKKDDAEVDACEQKPEWSEEDEKMIDAVIDIVSGSFYEPLCPRKEMLAWLKSLRPSWKPSEEQEEPEYYQHFDPDC